VAVNRVTFTVSSRMVFSKYKEEDKQLTGVPTFLTKLTVVAPLNKVAINVRKSSCQVADILWPTGRKLRIYLLILVRIVCYEISLKSFHRDAVGFRQTEGGTEGRTYMTQLVLDFDFFFCNAPNTSRFPLVCCCVRDGFQFMGVIFFIFNQHSLN